MGLWLLRLLSCSVLMVVCLSVEPVAQTTTSGGLTGVVADQSNAVVPDADVEIKDNAKGATQTTRTDREGVYRFFFLAPAKYLLTVSHAGFRKETRLVNVLLGPPVTVNFKLEVAGVTSEVTVTGEAPLIHAENGDVSATISQKQISEIPNPDNDLTYVAQIAPGVVMNTDLQGFNGGNFSILGMSGTSYLYTIDGLNNNENGTNLDQYGPVLFLGQNQVQEATVVSNGYSGQFGGAAGGNINYVTKSGNNQYHGNAQYYWNGRVLNANNWFLNAANSPRPFDIVHQWAASIGGPIKRDKVFFFLDHEGIRVFLPQVQQVIVPSPEFEAATIANIDSDPRFGPASATDTFYKQVFALYNGAPGVSSATPGGFNLVQDPTGCTSFVGPKTPQGQLGVDLPCALHFTTSRGNPSQEMLVAGRLDWVPSKKDRAFLRLQYDWGHSSVYVDPISPVFDDYFHQPWWQGQILETHTFGASGANQFLLAGSYFSPIAQVKNPSQTLAAFPAVLGYAPSTFTNLGGVDGFSILGYGRHNTQYQASEDIVKIWGKQKWGFGAGITRTLWNEFANNLAQARGAAIIGAYTAQTLRAFYDGGIDPESAGDYTTLTQAFTSQTRLPISFFNFSLYAQDEWQARPGLTLTVALRTEHYSSPVCRNRCFARLTGSFESISHDPGQPYSQVILANQKRALTGTDTLQWLPRFSFAWQPFGVAHSAVLRGGIGIFYDPFPGIFLDAFSGNSPLYNVYTAFANNLAPGEPSSLFNDVKHSNDVFTTGFANNETLAEIQNSDPNFSPPALSASTQRLHSPQTQKWSLEWQQGLGSDTSLSIGYFGHHGIHEAVQNPNANAFGFGSLPATKCATPPVPPCYDPRFSAVTELSANAVSNYNGAVVSLKHQFQRWTEGLFQANYTYGHAFDEVSNGGLFPFTTGSSINAQDPNNLRGAYGPAEYDVRHSFNANYVLEVPVKTALRGRGPDFVTKGWQLSGTFFARTGFPYTVFDFSESTNLRQNNYFGFLYAVPSSPLPSHTSCGEGAANVVAPQYCLPPEFSVSPNGTSIPNPNALFVQPNCETGFNTGTLPAATGACNGPGVSLAQGRNHFRGPQYFNTDFAIMKNTKLPGWENATLGLGFQFFNILNHPNFGLPINDMSNPNFGQIFYLEAPPTSLLGAPRMIELKAQLKF